MNENVNIGIEFEKKCQEKLISIGFENVSMTNHTDYGADLIAYEGNIKYIFQCKIVKQKQGVKAVQEILGAKTFYKANKTVVISQSGFTKQATELAQTNLCYLISGDDFFSLKSKEEFTNISIDSISSLEINYDLIQEYEKFKNKLGKTPTWRELDKTLRYKIKKDYGNYTNFTQQLNIPFSKAKPTKEQIKNEYLRIRNDLQKTPTGKEIKELSKYPCNSFNEYPLTKLQIECGDAPNLHKNVSKEKLKEEYLKVVKKLGHHPSKTELDQNGLYKYSQYANKWGNLKNFLNYANIPLSETSVNRSLSKSEIYILFALIEEILKIKENLVELDISTSNLKNLKYKDIPVLDSQVLYNISGSFESFIKSKKDNNQYSDFHQELSDLIQKYV